MSVKRKRISVILPAIIFSWNILMGVSFKDSGDFSYIWGDGWSVIRTLVVGVFYTIFFAWMLHRTYSVVETCKSDENIKLSVKVVTILFFIGFIFCYAPYLYAYYPGSINSDSIDQIAQYLGLKELTNHHPFFSSMLMGTFIKIGLMLGDSNLGMFLYVIMQTCILSFAFAYTIGLMIKWKIPRKFVGFVAVFYGIMPFWGGYAQLVIKDTLYTAVMVIFVSVFLDILLECNKGMIPKSKMIICFLVGVLLALLRNNGIYVVVPCILSGFLLNCKKESKRIWILGVCICGCAFLLWSSIILPLLNVKDGSLREMLSIPFQQTARYINEYPDEVTLEEREIINAVLDYEKIQSEYWDAVSDPVKNTYKEPETGELLRYFKHWIIMFFKHPLVYFEATIANSYSYYCLDAVSTIDPIYVDFIYQSDYTEYVGLSAMEENVELRADIGRYRTRFQEFPVVRLLFTEGFYTYLLIGMVGFLFYIKKQKYIVGLIPNIIGVLVCVASPILGSFRYFLPVVASTFICAAYCIKCREMDIL